MNAVVDTARSVIGGDAGVDAIPLNPKFRYLRVTINRRVALLVLGYLDRHPQGPIEVWYSADREVLRLQNGRVTGATGLTTEWRNVALPVLPSWTAIAGASKPVDWVRTRDVMPGYRYGVQDALRIRVAEPPTATLLQRLEPKTLTWFEEAMSADSRALPPARYGVELQSGRELVVYGEQCLEPELCFAWQRWPAVLPEVSNKK